MLRRRAQLTAEPGARPTVVDEVILFCRLDCGPLFLEIDSRAFEFD